MLFWAGYITGQALVGQRPRLRLLVLISGCGHPRIEELRITAASA